MLARREKSTAEAALLSSPMVWSLSLSHSELCLFLISG